MRIGILTGEEFAFGHYGGFGYVARLCRARIPAAIRSTGFYVPYGDVERTVKAIKMALKSKRIRYKSEGERIKKLFLTKRGKEN